MRYYIYIFIIGCIIAFPVARYVGPCVDQDMGIYKIHQ